MTEPTSARPRRTRIYKHPLLDSSRWDHFVPRVDDIIISTSYKVGTTWTQTIVANLIFKGDIPGAIAEISPWYDMNIRPFDDIQARLRNQSHRRFIKTHAPLDAIPYYEEVKYIFVTRDPRDVFMSLWHHHTRYTDELYNEVVAQIDDPAKEF